MKSSFFAFVRKSLFRACVAVSFDTVHLGDPPLRGTVHAGCSLTSRVLYSVNIRLQHFLPSASALLSRVGAIAFSVQATFRAPPCGNPSRLSGPATPASRCALGSRVSPAAIQIVARANPHRFSFQTAKYALSPLSGLPFSLSTSKDLSSRSHTSFLTILNSAQWCNNKPGSCIHSRAVHTIPGRGQYPLRSPNIACPTTFIASSGLDHSHVAQNGYGWPELK